MAPCCQSEFRYIWHHKKRVLAAVIIVEFLVLFHGLYANLACEDWMNGVFFLLHVSLIEVPRWVSHGMKVETTTIMLFNFSKRVLASYIDVLVKFSLVLLIVYDF